jgi:hypothetical protein
MFRRSALGGAASLAVVLLAVTGCKIQVSGAAPGDTSTAGAVQAGTSGVTRSGPLIVEPGAGFSPVYSLINGTRHSIDVTMYEFSDTTAEHDLAAAAKRGVRVRVILDRRARSVNSDAYSYLGSHRVAVTWSSPDYHYTHQKTVIIDETKAVIMTANLTSRYYATSRDFLVVDTERASAASTSRSAGRTRAASTTTRSPSWPGPGSGSATTAPLRLLHPRQGGRGRLRHQRREDLRRLGELLQHLPQPEP